jgi:hypothetical protein
MQLKPFFATSDENRDYLKEEFDLLHRAGYFLDRFYDVAQSLNMELQLPSKSSS